MDKRVTVTPPGPAGDASVTVPVAVPPPVTVAGLRLTLPIVPFPPDGGFIVSVADTLLADVAVIVAEALVLIANVEMANVPLL